MVRTITKFMDNQKELLEASRLLEVLSKFDALVILSVARNGIKSDASTHTSIGLTKKQYYTRLMQLKKMGLIEKKGSTYFHTTLGSFLHENCITALTHALKNREQMAMVDQLSRADFLSEDDLLRMKKIVCSMPSRT